MTRQKYSAFAGAAEIRKQARGLNQRKEFAVRKREDDIDFARRGKAEFGITTPAGRKALASVKLIDHYAKLMKKK
jgi:uncharacterized protein involved in type VI secretion and phage assembly